jgi:chaperone required for assembly of F1-ATPase
VLTKGKAQALELPKRFYASADPGVAESGFSVLLDGRPVKTPGGAQLVLPTAALAQQVSAEWALQGEHIVFPDMPATRLAFTAIDRTREVRGPIAEEAAAFAGSDLLCYFAEGPPSLVERELAHWGPVLDWAQAELGLHLVRASGIQHQPQPPEAIDRVLQLALAMDDFALTGFAAAAALFGSAILALALQRAELSGEAAFDLSRLDEAFQEERWGVDEEAAERTSRLRREAVALDHWFKALG